MASPLRPTLAALCLLAGCAAAGPGPKSPPAWVTAPAAVEAVLATGRCETPPADDPYGLLPPERMCEGRVPAPVAALLRALPEAVFHLSRERLERDLTGPTKFTAMRGMGARPDVMVWGNGWEVRSFEGPDPQTTFFQVIGPFDCGKATHESRYAATSSCAAPALAGRGYRVHKGVPVDVSARLLPKEPADAKAYRHYAALRGELQGPDESRLARVPVMRWYMTFDPEDPNPDTLPDSDPRVFGGENYAHLGFIVWNGREWAPYTTVPRAYWPCHPVEPGTRPCATFDETHDRFVKD